MPLVDFAVGVVSLLLYQKRLLHPSGFLVDPGLLLDTLTVATLTGVFTALLMATAFPSLEIAAVSLIL